MNKFSINTINLDIDNYSIHDLESFFKLKNTDYQAKDVVMRENIFREKFLKDGSFDTRYIRSMIEFLEKAKNILVYAKCPPLKQPTTLRHENFLDKSDKLIGGQPVSHSSRDSELTQRPNTQFIYTQNSDYLPGDMNPLKKRVISKFLNIDTRFRDNYYGSSSTDFTLQLPTKFNNVVSMQLSSFEIPVAFYGISSSYGNHYINIGLEYKIVDPLDPLNESDILITENRVFVIPNGNYIASDFIDTINLQFTKNKYGDTDSTENNAFYFISFFLDINEKGSGTGKLTLKLNKYYNSIIKPPIDIKNIIMDFTKDINGNQNTNIDLSTKIGWNLGYNKGIYQGQKSYEAETLVEPSSVRYIYLAIDDFNNQAHNMFISACNKSIFSPNIIARISIKGLYFSLLMENDLNMVTEPRVYFGPVDIQKLQVRLYDEFGRIVDMNSANFSFCLIIKSLYDL